MIERTLFREEHDIFRASVRKFVERESVQFHAKWEEDGVVPRELWLKAGARHVGDKKAREIWYINDRYTAEQAREMGLVNQVVPGGRTGCRGQGLDRQAGATIADGDRAGEALV